ncbi:MAG: AI-2E family transporter [Saprospiraceae bacterium]|nr:AI-2E family transporter [Saprospiraceae bacterium]MBK8514365.1 AI-2E family transporter [Saprospiraceae bacterium]
MNTIPPWLTFNNQIKQLMILMVLLVMIYLVTRELYVFLPGLFGALTLYIISRGSYFQLIYHFKWKKGWTAGLYLLFYLLLVLLLVLITYNMLKPQIQPLLSDPATMVSKAKIAIETIQVKAGFTMISEETLSNLQDKLNVIIPSMLNDTANLLANLALMFFVLYYMLVHGKAIESYLSNILPLKPENIHLLAVETKRLVKVSALGIPLISIIQGVTGAIGYYLFGVQEYGLWGFLTAIFAFFPVVGTMIIWIPLVLYMYMSGDTLNAFGLGLYSLLITGNVDYLFRITFLNKVGHVHPIITVLGVIAGLNLFGFIGLIFGPLLLSYIILLFRIYANEFLMKKPDDVKENTP